MRERRFLISARFQAFVRRFSGVSLVILIFASCNAVFGINEPIDVPTGDTGAVGATGGSPSAGAGGTHAGEAGVGTNGGIAGNVGGRGNNSGGTVGGIAGASSSGQGGVGNDGGAGMSGDAGADTGGDGAGGDDGGWTGSVEWFVDPKVLTPGSYPTGLALDPDGNLWFTMWGANKIGRLTPEGAMHAYPTLPQRDGLNAKPFSILFGPDGNLWFTQEGTDRIGCMTPRGETHHVDLEFGRRPRVIAVGGDGNLWFTEALGRRIGRLPPVCSVTQTEPPTEWTASVSGGRPWGLAAGMGNQIWFTVGTPERLVAITPSGPFLEVVLPSGAHPTYIATHPNGSVWFSETQHNRIGRWQDNVLTHFDLSSGGAPNGIGVDQRGNLWIAHADEVIHMNPNGEILNVVPVGAATGLHGLLVANDGVIWLAAELSDRIGRIKP